MPRAALPGYCQATNFASTHEIKDLAVPIQVFSVCSPRHENGHYLGERSNYMLIIFGSNGRRMSLHHPGVCRHQGEEIRHVERIEACCRAKRPNPPQCVIEFELVRNGGI